MINLQEKPEHVLLVGVETLENSENFESSMEELADLTQTADGLVIEQLTQKRERPDNRYLIGSGKLEELRLLIERSEIDTVIFNERLSPRQNINLEESLGVKVIDRMQLILDIFARRARSHEGMLQVEQAQLNYMLPRLIGKGVSLSRQAGGIGSKGPGESQLELDRRYIRIRIENIERQLKKVEKTRKTIRQKRNESGIFKIGLIGYTNAGKTSILNALTDKVQYEKDELFATLDVTTKIVQLKGEFTVSLTDTVGFIQDLPTELIKAFKSTLEESLNVDLLIHVIDASNPHHQIHEETVEKIRDELVMEDIPVLNIYNKIDKTENFVSTVTPSVQLSIKSENGPKEFCQAVLDKLLEMFTKAVLKLPYTDAYKLPKLRRMMIVDELEEKENFYLLSGYISPDLVWQIEKYQ